MPVIWQTAKARFGCSTRARQQRSSFHALQVDRLQTRLERMGRMETSMVATRRRGDESAWATQRRMTNTLIAVGACAGGALAAWLIVSRVQHLK